MADIFDERASKKRVYKKKAQDIFDERAIKYEEESVSNIPAPLEMSELIEGGPKSAVTNALKNIPAPLAMPELISGGPKGAVEKLLATKQATPGSNLIQGLKASAPGQALGFTPQYPTEEQSMAESLKFKAGALAGDIPAMSLGGTLGGAIAGGLGAGPLGAAIGAGAGAFGLPELIKQISSYVRNPKKEGAIAKIGQIADIPVETAKSALIGAATGGAGRLAPLFKIANTKTGQEAIKSAAELIAMTGAQAAITGDMPSAKDVAENVLLLGAMKAAGAGASKIGKLAGKEPLVKETPEFAPTEVDIFMKRAKEVTPKLVDRVISKIKKEQPYFDVLRDVIGKKHEKLVVDQDKWSKVFEKAELKNKSKFTPEEYEDAMYYAQKTTNPNVDHDSMAKIIKRIPVELRNIMNKDLTEHFKTTLEERNKNPYLKTVIPREEVVAKYLPGLYKNPEKFNSVSKKVRSRDPFTNKKAFLDYNEALREGGLKPRYNNVRKLIQIYDEVVAKEFAAADMLENIHKLEKQQGRRLIVTKNNPREYINALHDGFVPYDDVMLRRVRDAKIPEASKAFQEKFPDINFIENVDNFKDYLKEEVKSGRLKSEYLKNDKNIDTNINEFVKEHGADIEEMKKFLPKTMSKFPTEAPALVAPELSPALRGIFNKDAYKPGNPIATNFWKGYDATADTIRTGRVKMSFFHYVPLAESLAGGIGIKKAFSMKNVMKQGQDLLNDLDFRKTAARSGLIIHKPLERWETSERVTDKMFDTAIKLLPEQVVNKTQKSMFNKGLTKYIDAQKFLFEKFHPRIKSVVWKHYVDGFIDKGINEGKPPTPQQVIKIQKQMADRVNAEFGGQNWEIQRGFNNPEYRKWLRRVIAYPDWTISAIKQAAGVLSGGLKGEQARKYFLRVGLNTMLVHGTLKYLMGGFKKAEPGDKLQIGGVAWSPTKAKEEITDPDPIEWFKFPLPDIPIEIAGIKFNPGREAPTEWKKVGSKLYTHSGKQFLEIKDWYKHPVTTFFNKSNPLLSMVYKQMTGRTPSKDEREGFAVRGKFARGKFQPWDATKSGTSARAVSRAASLASEPIPFSIKSAKLHGVAPFIATGLGAVPISKGATPYKSEPELIKAFEKHDIKRVNRIRRALKDNGYTDKQIKRVVTISRKQAKL